MEERKNIDLVWNLAVGKVGGMQNTRDNFMTIANEFLKLAKQEGYSDKEIGQEVNDNYDATSSFMEGVY